MVTTTGITPGRRVPPMGSRANMRVFVWTGWLDPVPAGVDRGSVRCRGAVARGYLRQSPDEREAVRPCPFGQGGERFVPRTGDLAEVDAGRAADVSREGMYDNGERSAGYGGRGEARGRCWKNAREGQGRRSPSGRKPPAESGRWPHTSYPAATETVDRGRGDRLGGWGGGGGQGEMRRRLRRNVPFRWFVVLMSCCCAERKRTSPPPRPAMTAPDPAGRRVGREPATWPRSLVRGGSPSPRG